MDHLGDLHPHGVFLRREALALGYDDRALYSAVRSGELARVRTGAFVDAARWKAAGDRGKHLLRANAVGLTHAPPMALSHVSGALAHGMHVWGVDLTNVHVTRDRPCVGRRTRDIAYHLGLERQETTLCAGTPTLLPVACALGTAALTSIEAGAVVIDSAYTLGLCDVTDVRAQADLLYGWPGTAKLRITLNLAEPGSQSVGESRMRYWFWRWGVPKPVLQYEVMDGSTLVGIADFAWPEYGLLGEFDGRVKYEKLLRPGESPADVVYREKVREDRMREVTGWSMIRFSWGDLDHQERTAQRLVRALQRRH